MATFSPFAAYYRITWNLTTPTNYTGSNNTGGGINPFNSRQYHSMIATTGNVDVSGGYGGGMLNTDIRLLSVWNGNGLTRTD